jgi:hypothetical protein
MYSQLKKNYFSSSQYIFTTYLPTIYVHIYIYHYSIKPQAIHGLVRVCRTLSTSGFTASYVMRRVSYGHLILNSTTILVSKRFWAGNVCQDSCICTIWVESMDESTCFLDLALLCSVRQVHPGSHLGYYWSEGSVLNIQLSTIPTILLQKAWVILTNLSVLSEFRV